MNEEIKENEEIKQNEEIKEEPENIQADFSKNFEMLKNSYDEKIEKITQKFNDELKAKDEVIKQLLTEPQTPVVTENKVLADLNARRLKQKEW